MPRSAGVIAWRQEFRGAVDEAVRCTLLYREKFGPPDAPPYRVRKRRRQWSERLGRNVWNQGRRDIWLILTPTGDIPDRRAS